MVQQTRSDRPGDTSKQTYEWYMHSTKWERRRHAYYANHKKQCRACASTTNIHLHHHTYKRFMAELDTDLVPLCQGCHDLVHKLHKENPGMSLTRATRKFLQLYGADLDSVPGKVRAKSKPRVRRPRRLREPKAPVSPFKVGDRVRFISVPQAKAFQYVLGCTGTVIEHPYSRVWRVQLDDGGPTIAVAPGHLAKVGDKDPGRKDPVNNALARKRDQRRVSGKVRLKSPVHAPSLAALKGS